MKLGTFFRFPSSVLGLSRNVRNLGWVSFFNDISSEMIYPLLPLFLTQVLGAGVVFVGLIEGIAESISSFLKLFSGWFSDRFQKRKGAILLGYSLASVTRPFMALATSSLHGSLSPVHGSRGQRNTVFSAGCFALPILPS